MFVGDAVQIHGAANGFPGYDDPRRLPREPAVPARRGPSAAPLPGAPVPRRGRRRRTGSNSTASRPTGRSARASTSRPGSATRPTYVRDAVRRPTRSYSPFARVAEELGYSGDPTLEPSPFFTTLHGYCASCRRRQEHHTRWPGEPAHGDQTLEPGAEDRRPQGPAGADAGRGHAGRRRLPRRGRQAASRPGRAQPLRQGAAGPRADHAAAAASLTDVGRLHRGRRHRPRGRRGLRARHRRPARLRARPRASTSATTTPVASPWVRTPTTSSSGSPPSPGATATSA